MRRRFARWSRRWRSRPAEKQHGELDEATTERVKAMSAATDNVGVFFGEDIFLAIASILLIQSSLKSSGSS
jgi:uncharacterized membrane protein